MSNSSLSTAHAFENRHAEIDASRLTLFAVVFLGKALDAISTVTVLSLRDDVYESMWLTRTLLERFGMVTGISISVIIAVGGVLILAESGELVTRVVPDEWASDEYATAFRLVTTCSAGVWYAFLGVHNFSLLF